MNRIWMMTATLVIVVAGLALVGAGREWQHARLAFGQFAHVATASLPLAERQARLQAVDACLARTYGRAQPWQGLAASAQSLQSQAAAKFTACWDASARPAS